MTPLKQQWIDTLYAGTYQQTHGVLRREDEYCCLGVLCDLYDSTGWGPKTPKGSQYYSGHECYPPYAVSLASGLTLNDRSLLGILNDHYRFTFEAIADYILHCQEAGVELYDEEIFLKRIPL